MAKGPPPPIEIKPAQGGKLMAGLSSNGWPVLVWYSNAVLQIELKP